VGRQLLALAALALLVIAGLGGLARLKFSSFLSDSVSERLEIVASTSAQDFETATDLGLALGEVANGKAILARARQHDSDISAIVVFDLDGNIIHAAGEPRGDRVDAATLDAFRLAQAAIADGTWGDETDQRVSSGVIIEGAFGQAAGAIVVEYPTSVMDGQTQNMTRRLLRDGLIVAIGVGAMMLVVLVLTRTHHDQFDRSNAVDAVSTDGE
jgi:hypothetical protein